MKHEIVNNEAGNPKYAPRPDRIRHTSEPAIQCVDTLCLLCCSIHSSLNPAPQYTHNTKYTIYTIYTPSSLQSGHAHPYISHPIQSFASQPFCSFGFIHLRVGFAVLNFGFAFLWPQSFPPRLKDEENI